MSGSASSVGDAWDGPWRKRLVDNAAVLVGQLQQVGITEIFLDGSFVEAKPHPKRGTGLQKGIVKIVG